MRQRFFWIYFWLSVWSAACAPDQAAAQQWPEPDAPALTADPGQVGCPIRYTLRHFEGQAPGYDTGVTRFEVFIPLAELDASNLLFCDLQPMVYNDGSWGSNLGLGFRWYSPSFDRVFGVYGYFDYRETTYNRFQQGTLGFDSMGNWIEARGNVYLPSQEKMQLPQEAVAAPHFVGHDLRYGGYETAMLGGDVELGVRVPEIMGTQSRVLAGLYHFDGGDQDDVSGWKARIETDWTANLSTDLALYDDDVFGTTVMVGVAFNLQTESFSPWCPQIHSFRRGPQRHVTDCAADRLAEPVYRLPNIGVRHGEYRAAFGAGDGSGGVWQILHVAEGATGGDGTFERPFGTLDEAMAVAQAGSIVYTPYGGNYQPAPIFVVPEGVALLSNAPVQYIPTDVGLMQLPLSGASPDLSAAPQVLGSVTMSSGATLNGFWVVGNGDTLGEAGVVRMVGQSDVTVVNNVIWSRQEGLWIEDAMHAIVANNTVAQASGSGIFMLSATDVALTGNRVNEAGGDGIEVLNGAYANITGNEIVTAQGNGITLTQGDHANVSDNLIGLVGQNGIEVFHGDSVNVNGNQIAAALGDGIRLTDAASASVTNNAIETAAGHGIELLDSPLASVAGNRIGNVGGHGITVGDATGAEILGNFIASAGGDGIRVSDANNAALVGNEIASAGENGLLILGGANVELRSNEIQRALQNGIAVSDAANAVLADNDVQIAGGDGIRITSAANVAISGNRLEHIDKSGVALVGVTGGLVTDNTVGFAGLHGFQIVDGNELDIVANTVERAMGNGVDIRGLDFLGTVRGNTITEAQAGVQAVLTHELSIDLSDNSLTQNRGHGIYLQAGQFVDGSFDDGSIVSGNTIEKNGAEGLNILTTGSGISTLGVYDNTLILNHVILGAQYREFVARLAGGADSLIVELGGNKSYNLVSPGEFNYDFLNDGGFDLQYLISAPNVGSLGSSNGSVP